MGLEEYFKKREIEKSKEPGYSKKSVEGRFVLHHHYSEGQAGEHYDIRFGKGNRLISFVLPKAKIPKEGEKYLLIHTEDHPSSYIDFEGRIEEGYGKGDVKIDDRGTYEVIEGDLDNLKKPVKMKIEGKKLKGVYTIVPFKDNFLFIKSKEKKAGEEEKILYTDKWFTIKQKNDWTYISSPERVLIFVYRYDNGSLQFLVRNEYISYLEDYIETVVSGTVEDDEDLESTVIRELKEECGLVVNEGRLEYITYVRDLKLSDSKWHVFLVDVSGVSITEKEPDSYSESISTNVWIDYDNFKELVQYTHELPLKLGYDILLRIDSLRYKKSSYPEHPDTIIIQPNEFYKDGLTEKDIYEHYQKVKSKILKYIEGYKVLFRLKVDGEVITRKDELTEENYDDLITGRTVEIHRVIPTSKTKLIWVDIDPHEKVDFEKSKEYVKPIVDLMKENFDTESIEIFFSGNRGFYVVGNLKEEKDVDECRKKLKELLDEFFESDEIATTGIAKPDQIRFDVTTLKRLGSIKVPYSLSIKTGLAAVPVSLSNLKSFKKKDAVIRKLTKIAMKQFMDHDNWVAKEVRKYKDFQNMKSLRLKELQETIEGKNVVVSVKYDGEITGLYWNRKTGECFTSSIQGRIRRDFFITKEFDKIMQKTSYNEILLIGELFAVDEEGEHLTYNKVLSILRKPTPQTEKQIRFAVFDIIKLNGKPVDLNEKTNPYFARLSLIKKILDKNEYIFPILVEKGGSDIVEKLWKSEVIEKNMEGIVVFEEGTFYKVKPVFDVDVVVVGVEKSSKHPDMMGALLVAFIGKDGFYYLAGKIGTGFTHNQRKEWIVKARTEGVREEKNIIWIPPKTVISVRYENINNRKVPVYRYHGDKGYVKIRYDDGYVFIKGRFIQIREDKKPTHQDVRFEQIPDFVLKRKLSSISDTYFSFIVNFSKLPSLKRIFPNISEEEIQSVITFVKDSDTKSIAFYNKNFKKIFFDLDSFMQLYNNDNKLKLYKVLVHELTHYNQDKHNRLETGTSNSCVEQYFQNSCELEALVNEIVFFSLEGLSFDEIKELFKDSFKRFEDADKCELLLHGVIDVIEGVKT